MTKKTYTVSITYVGEVEAEDEDELEESLYGAYWYIRRTI